MAEEEKIRGYAKRALQALTDKTKKWKDRLKDFAWEVFIILVAVNITLWFHSWSEKRHNREIEKEFLIGTREDLDPIKNDLNNDLNQILNPLVNYYDTINKQITEHRIDKAFADTNAKRLIAGQIFTYDDSRFESFKSSGYLRLIENPTLQKNITALFTQLTNQTEWDKSFYDERRQNFTTYISTRLQMDSLIHISPLLNIPEVKYQMVLQNSWANEIQRQKQQLLQDINNVQNAIDKELKDRFNYQVPEKKSR